MAEGAELVAEALPRPVLEGVGVHRVEAEAERGGTLPQLAGVGRLVPRDVQRHAGRAAGEPVDDGRVVQLLEHVARLAGPGEAAEARAAGAERPRRERDLEAPHRVDERVDAHAAALEALAERGEVACVGGEGGAVGGGIDGGDGRGDRHGG